MTGRPFGYLSLVIVALLSIIATSGLLAWARHEPAQIIEIHPPPPPELTSDVYIGGEVVSPGFYRLKAGDSLDDLLRAAGGLREGADPNQVSLYFGEKGEAGLSQKVDLNRADAWLLQALPGIGETRARAILDYRQKNGGFRSARELLNVEGIGRSVYDQVKDLVTVVE